ncbi:Transmembrane protein [Phytophthora megakarya]|uniref:Transmembrane protein n=1 Tax=Phytophthora megakarya TaxID=4795 RepID=A0A225V3F1_9STRA|nr:Transmembrane protein [Phytophthora megakarya]
MDQRVCPVSWEIHTGRTRIRMHDRDVGGEQNGNEDEYETPFFSDIISSDPTSSDGLTRREFITLTKEKLDCVKNEKLCLTAIILQTWRDKFSTEEED